MGSLALTATPRRVITKLHRWSGLTLLAFLFIAAVTGALLAFRWEVDALLNPGLFKVKAEARPMQLQSIIDKVEQRFPGALVSSITYPKGPEEALRLSLKSKMSAHVAHKHVPGMKAEVAFNQVFANPYSGEILGQRNTSEFVLSRVNFVPFMVRLHYSLFLEKWGVWLMGGCALIWFLTSFLGLALSWPRLWTTWKSWRPVLAIRSRQGGYKFNYDLHRSASVLTLPVLIVVAFTSIYLNLPDVVKPIVASFSPIGSNMNAPGVGRVEIGDAVISPEQAAAAALQVLPQAQVYSVSRDFRKGLYTVRLRLPGDVSPAGNNSVFVSMADGDINYIRLASARSGADTFIAWQLPLHSGLAFGLTGQLLVCIGAIAMIAMCVTGFNVWLRKYRSEKQLAARRQDAITPNRLNPPAAPLGEVGAWP